MIDRLYVQNFKCFAEQSVPLGGLTILAGLNGAGKSSVLQALLLLRQSGLHSDGTPGQMRWQGDLVDVGSFSEVLYEGAQQDFVVLEARFASKVQSMRKSSRPVPMVNRCLLSGDLTWRLLARSIGGACSILAQSRSDRVILLPTK